MFGQAEFLVGRFLPVVSLDDCHEEFLVAQEQARFAVSQRFVHFNFQLVVAEFDDFVNLFTGGHFEQGEELIIIKMRQHVVIEYRNQLSQLKGFSQQICLLDFGAFDSYAVAVHAVDYALRELSFYLC